MGSLEVILQKPANTFQGQKKKPIKKDMAGLNMFQNTMPQYIFSNRPLIFVQR